MIELEKIPPGVRAAGVVGDLIGDLIGKPVDVYPALTFTTVTQPAGSNLLSGGGIAYATAIAVAFTHAGRHVFSISADDAVNLRQFEVVIWPAAALTVDRIRYTAQDRLVQKPDDQRRGILRALANHASTAGITAHIEGGTSAPYYGTNPALLGASGSYAVFGGW